MAFSLVLTGCKSAPELTAAQAQALIQEKYGRTAPFGANITVDEPGNEDGRDRQVLGPVKGVTQTNLWADFTLTPDGRKAVTLPRRWRTIQWRPQSADDKTFSVVVVTTAANHLKARDVQEPQDEVGGTKSVVFTEAVSLDGVPSALQDIAHNPGNQLSSKKSATFAVVNGAWALPKSIS